MKLPEENDILWGYASLIINGLARILPNAQSDLKSSLLSGFAALSDMDVQHTDRIRGDNIGTEEDQKTVLMGAKSVFENLKNIQQNGRALVSDVRFDELGRFIDSLDQSINCLISAIRLDKSKGIRGIYVILDPEATKGMCPSAQEPSTERQERNDCARPRRL